MKIFTIFSLICLPVMSVLNAQEISLTVTNQNLALVKEVTELDLKKGISNYEFRGVPQKIDPTSVHILSVKSDFEVLEQNFEFDLLNTDKILDKSLEQTITISHPEAGVVSGTLLFSDNRSAIIETESGELRIIPRNPEQQIIIKEFDKNKNGFITRPTLVWLLNSEKNGESEAEISYLTGGLNWHAEYVALLNKNDDEMNLAAWVSLDNKSGKAYQNAKLKLMAGDLNLVSDQQIMYDRPRGYETSMAKAAPQQFEQKEFFEYHLYTLARKTTIKNNQTKQIQLFEPADVNVQKTFNYNYRKDAEKVAVMINFKNDKDAGLGLPLPKGKVRLFKADQDDLEFIGESSIDHTPKNELIEMEIGKAFDVRADRNVLESAKLSKRSEKQKIQIVLKNHKDSDIEVIVTEPFWGYRKYDLIKSNIEPFERDAGKLKFKVPVKAQSEAELNFELLFTW